MNGSAHAVFQASPVCAGPCPAGTYQNRSGATVGCDECDLGCFCPKGSVVPVNCPDGFEGSRPGLSRAAECSVCPPGAWCHAGRAHPCGRGLHAGGAHHTQRTSLFSCSHCPERANRRERVTTFGTGTADEAGCVCEAGFVRLQRNKNMCNLATEPGAYAIV